MMEGLITIILIGWITNLVCILIMLFYTLVMIFSDYSLTEAIIRLEKLDTTNGDSIPWSLLFPFSGILVMIQLIWNQYQFDKTETGDYIDFMNWYNKKEKKKRGK